MENKTNGEIERFKDLLRYHHYSSAFIYYLLAKLEALECTFSLYYSYYLPGDQLTHPKIVIFFD